jgi:predicted alpha/beta superfamily hydrolase
MIGKTSLTDRLVGRVHYVPLFAMVISVAFVSPTRAQTTPPQVALERSAQFSLPSKFTGRTYEIMVSVPVGYEKSDTKYPVLYALDGWHFPLLAFIQQNSAYSSTKRMPPVIIVVIGHGKQPNLNELREQDFLGPTVEPKGISGHAERFLTFIEGELIPFIDGRYRTVPSDRALLGHSYGGAFAIYALAERPALFQRIVCVSPAFGSTRTVLFRSLTEHLASLRSPVALDVSVGTDGDLIEETSALWFQLDMTKASNLRRTLTVYNGENHDSVRLNAFPAGLYWVYR